MTSTWRLMPDGKLTALAATPLELERDLEDMLESHPEIIFGQPLLVIGRQNTTDLNKAMDLLAIDQPGRAVIAELKKGQTPRDVIAQALEYTSFVATLDYSDLSRLANDYFQRRQLPWSSLDQAWAATFAPDEPPPTETSLTWNGRQRIAIVAEQVSQDIERVCRYLRRSKIDISAVSVTLFKDADGSRLISSDEVVGSDEPASASDVVSSVDVEELIPIDVRTTAARIRTKLSQSLGLREYTTPTGFSYGPRPNPRDIRVAGLYVNAGRLQFYAYRTAANSAGADLESFYKAARDLGLETSGEAGKSITVRSSDHSRVEALLDAFVKLYEQTMPRP